MRHAAAALFALFASCACPLPARADIAPRFTQWFQSVGGSAQALADGDAARAEALAREAIAARPHGAAAERATLALGLALRASHRADATALVEAGSSSIDPRARDDVLRGAPPAGPAPSPSPSPPPAPTATPLPPEDRIAAAERLVLDARPHDALAALGALAADELTAEQRERSRLLRAWSLLQLGRREDAAAVATDVASAPDSAPGTRTGAALALARIAARARRFDDAIARYQALARGSAVPVPGLPASAAAELPGEAAYLAAWLQFDAGRWRSAARDLTRFADEHPRSPRATDARWFAAWAAFRDRRIGAARAAWARLERTPLAPAALYWQARTSTGPRARARYLKAIEAEPGGWYAFLAAGRLRGRGEKVSALPAATPSVVPQEVPVAAADAMARATVLLELGLRDAAIAVLRGLASAPGGRAAASPVAELSEAAGEAELTLRIARDQLPLSRRALRWQHPLAFGAGLDALAAASGVDPLLFRALIRRESTFRAEARSPAGAEGLVQLMPYTAERLAAVLGARGADAPALRDHETSLALGAAYLGLLLDRFDDPAAALAAYNGGPVPVAGWAAAHAGTPLDEAVEELPFRETRRYVKIVMAAYATYRHLHAGAPASIDGARRLARPRPGVAF